MKRCRRVCFLMMLSIGEGCKVFMLGEDVFARGDDS